MENGGWVVDDVAMFPIVWGKSALESQAQLCNKKMASLKGSLTGISHLDKSLQADLHYTSTQLLANLHQSALIDQVGICFGFDYVVTAHKQE
jgi:hypothetical protein